MVSVIYFYRTVWFASSPHMRRNPSPPSTQKGRLAAVSLGIFLLSYMTTWPVLAQDLELDLPEESGPAVVHPAQPSAGKTRGRKLPQEEEPVAEAAREAPQETPQVQYERRPEKGVLGNLSDRLLNILSGDNGTKPDWVVGRFRGPHGGIP